MTKTISFLLSSKDALWTETDYLIDENIWFTFEHLPADDKNGELWKIELKPKDVPHIYHPRKED